MAIKDLFTQIDDAGANIDDFDPINIRRELFKLYYVDELFDLFGQADCFEAIDKILTVMHHWLSNTPMGGAEENPCKK